MFMRITFVVGARPQFIKLAPIWKVAKSTNNSTRIVHTGQHYDYKMSEVFFSELKIPKPEINLEVGSLSHAKQTGMMLEKLEEEFTENIPDWVVVFGDTNSTLAGALAASKLRIKIAHVEAGLRSYNKDMPEEINRLVTDHVSDLLFVPTEQGMKNLKLEGLESKSILTGDLMADLVRDMRKETTDQKIKYDDYCLLTLHRPASVDNPSDLNWILEQVASLETNIIFPAHPRTLKAISKNKIKLDKKIKIIEPQSYLDFQALIANCKCVITDSGGIQKEAYLWRKACFTIRSETEWKETVDLGWNKIIVPKEGNLRKNVNSWKEPAIYKPIYGTGDSARIIIEKLEHEK